MLDKDLFSLLGKDKKYVAYITIIDLIGVLANIAITAFICLCLDLTLKQSRDAGKYVLYIFLALACGGLKVFTIYFSGKIKNTLGNNVKKSIRKKAYAKLLDMGLGKSVEQTAAITQMTVEGVEQLDSYYTAYLPSFFVAMIAPILLFIISAIFRYQVALVLLCALPLIPISIVIVSKWARRTFSKYWDKYTSMGNGFLDSLQGMKELKIFNACAAKQVEIAVKSEDFRVITMKVLVMQLTSLTIIDIVAFGASAVAIVFAILGATASVNAISPIIALFLILISAEFFLPMRALASAFHVAMNGSTAGKKIKTLLDLENPKWGNKIVQNAKVIALENVDFSYDNERIVIRDLNVDFKKGFNAVVGESGSGKSTIINLLLGAYLPQKGKATLNGHYIREYDRSSYYSNITSVSYNTFIFNRSIRDNFRLAKNDIKDDEIFQLLEKVNLKTFVENIGGLDYIILEDSENISGGERQRLALAINLVEDTDIYLFDEVTSNIDIESEAIIMKEIQALAKEKIVVVISHRLQNVVVADKIYMLENGKLIESGTHKELMSKNGKYASVYNEQYALENDYKTIAISRKSNSQKSKQGEPDKLINGAISKDKVDNTSLEKRGEYVKGRKNKHAK